MIWLIMGIIVLAVLLYVAKPLYTKDAPVVQVDSEVADYLEQISNIDTRLKNADKSTDVSALELAKIELQRQVLAKEGAGKDAYIDNGPQSLLLSVLFIAFTFGAIGIYVTLGRPDLTKTQELVQRSDLQDVNDLTLEQAVAQLEQKLSQGDQNPQGWMLYARSLMSLRRYDDAIKAYEKVMLLTGSDPKVLEEFESAKEYIAQKQAGVSPTTLGPTSGPSAEQMQAAAAMTPKARQDMIKGMVEGLSQKLRDASNDADGWTRLLRARKVLGQESEALADITLLRAAFKDDPDVVQKILTDTGWAED